MAMRLYINLLQVLVIALTLYLEAFSRKLYMMA